jgi:hypothetical protein
MGIHTQHYRAQAKQCEEMAERAPSDDIRADCLRLAVMWLRMASGEPFGEPVQDFRVTTINGQADSTTSH